MAQDPLTLDEIITLVRQLRPEEKLRLAEQALPDLGALTKPGKETPAPNCYGALSDLGAAPSAEEIDQARAEMFANFPRNNVA